MLKLANWLWAFLKNGDAFNSLEVIEPHKNTARSGGKVLKSCGKCSEEEGGKGKSAWLALRTLAPGAYLIM